MFLYFKSNINNSDVAIKVDSISSYIKNDSEITRICLDGGYLEVKCSFENVRHRINAYYKRKDRERSDAIMGIMHDAESNKLDDATVDIINNRNQGD